MIRIHLLCSISATVACGVALAACGTDAQPIGGGGGATGMGGGATMGGPLTPADAKITGTVTQCPGTTPGALPDVTVNACVREACSDAACVSVDLIQQFTSTDLSLLGDCGDPNVKCLPIDFIATTGDFQAKTCTSLAGAEGRCMSTCIPQVADLLAFLPQADCAPSERCAPCYDPRKGGEDTQACHQGCDPGPTQPPVVFQECGSGLGFCVPQDVIPANLRTFVPVADCTQAGYACAPKTNVADINHVFTPCEPSSAIIMTLAPPPAPNGQKGACVPAYLVDYQEPQPPPESILQDTCDAGYLCAPCSNPLKNNEPTGACPT
jgi:hypothetical protein